MKNYKFIPLLAVAALMTACNTSSSKVSVKAPSFAKLGEEVEYEEFKEAVSKQDLIGPWMNIYTEHLPSAVVSATGSYQQTMKLVSNKKTVEEGSLAQSLKCTIKYDKNNMRFSIEDSNVYRLKSVDQKAKIDITENLKTNQVGQFSDYTVGEETFNAYMIVDNIGKTYEPRNDSSNYNDLEKKSLMEYEVDYAMHNYGFLPDNVKMHMSTYENSSPEEKEDYKFYVNGKIFTLIYTNEYSRTEIDASSNNAKFIATSVTTNKYQIDATNRESYKYKVSEETTTNVEYLMKYLNNQRTRYIGDKETQKMVNYFDVDVQAKDVTIKEADFSKYNLLAAI